MTRIPFVRGEAQFECNLNGSRIPPIGFVINGPGFRKGWIQQEDYHANRFSAMCLDGGHYANNWKSKTSIEEMKCFLAERAAAAWIFPDTKMLFRWLGSDQPVSI